MQSMHNLNNQLSNKILIQKIKSILFSLGMNEMYVAFNYLTVIISYLIVKNEDSVYIYKNALKIISTEFSISEKTVIQSINRLLKNCNASEITNKIQFKISANPTLNKIRTIKTYILTRL